MKKSLNASTGRVGFTCARRARVATREAPGTARSFRHAAPFWRVRHSVQYGQRGSVMLPICAPQIAAAVKNGEKISIFLGAPPPFCNAQAPLVFKRNRQSQKKSGPSLVYVRPRSGKNEPSRGLGCRFVDQNVAHVSHTPCRRQQYCTVAHKRHAQEHRVENWSYSASPARAAGADQTKMAWLAAGSQALTASRPAAA